MIFDMDGVLVHSMPLHVTAWVEYLRRMGIDVPDLERRMHGKRNTELVWEFIGKDVSEADAIEHGAAKERLFREMMAAGAPGEFDIQGVLPFLDRYRHVPKAIGSNAEENNINFILDKLGLRPYFQFAINGMQVERPKPFPDIYLECARRLGFAPANCIVFEDSPAGAEAGLAAGMRVVGVESTPTQFRGIALQINHFADPRLEQWLSTQRPVS
jgi:beta-phosphoglucomutase